MADISLSSESSPDIDFSQAGALGNRLLQKVNALRAADPLYFSSHQNAWIVTSHERVVEAFKGGLPLSSQQQEVVASFIPDAAERKEKIGYLLDIVSTWMNFSDGAKHERLRKLMVKAFGRNIAEKYRPSVRQFVNQTLDHVAGKTVVDVMEELALPVPILTILQLAGLTTEHRGMFEEAAQLATETLGGYPTVSELERANNAFLRLYEPLLAVVHERRANPGEDFVSTLVQAEVDGERLTDFEIVGQMTLLLLAGHESTTSTIALSLAALSTAPDACDFIRRNPDKILDATMELMRFVAMSTSMSRIVAEDFDWHGRQLKKGQFVHLMIAGANRDPAVFSNPEVLDVTRPQYENMTFAPGLHHCIGHLFAKMEVSEFLIEFLNRYESFDLENPEITFNNSITFRGPRSMTMRLTPRQHAA